MVSLRDERASKRARAINQHLKIGIAAIDLLREEGVRLHSRKLRAFDEPPFR